jgi:Ni,Fe-hydrogenase III small subunit/ferredoxin
MSESMGVKTLIIDGQELSARAGQTILEVARENEINIPTLCHMEGLSNVGACRLCLVEIKGSNKLLPACVANIHEGMEVVTNSERLKKHRRVILELLFAERNHICAVCVSNGHCELQALAQELGLTHINLPYRNPALTVDASHERFTADHNRCILCSRCVRVCAEIEGAHIWDVMGRGIDSLRQEQDRLRPPQVSGFSALPEPHEGSAMSKLKVATVWLDGCSGCHMSFLDMDERLLKLAELIDIVYSPIVDAKIFPDEVDIALVEGAVASVDDEVKIKKVRAHSKMLIAMGDCAVAGNVPSMRNPIGPEKILDRAYIENADAQQQIPCVVVPKLLKIVRPIHEFVTVDVFLPGCPPSADTFYTALTALVTGAPLDISALTRFGA